MLVLSFHPLSLYCTVLHGTVPCCTVLYYTILYCTAMYVTILYSIVHTPTNINHFKNNFHKNLIFLIKYIIHLYNLLIWYQYKWLYCIGIVYFFELCSHTYQNIQYCTVLYCTVTYITALKLSVLYCTVLYCNVLYHTILYCIVL